MGPQNFLRRWFVIILMVAVGIGIVGALSIRNVREREENSAHPSSYLTNQRRHDIDLEELAGMTGSYSSDRRQLTISEEAMDQGPYLAVTESPEGFGFEGPIMYLRDGIVIIELDKGAKLMLPPGWETDSSGDYLVLDYELKDSAIELGYRGDTILFDAQ